MTTPLLTVLIDTYNYGRFIEEAIASVLSQDFPMEQVQVLVVDDGSTDDTPERVKKYGSRIEYFYKANGGQASALNAGFARARGEIVVLLDADDYFLPGKLRRVAGEFQKHPEAGMIYHSLVELQVDSGKPVEPLFASVSELPPGDKKKLVAFGAYPTCCLAFRRKVVEQLLPIPESLRLQADGYIELLAVLVAPVIAMPETLAVYRIHGQNLCYLGGNGSTLEEMRRRIDWHLNLLGEVKAWTERHKSELKRAHTRLFLRSQLLQLEERRFKIDHPGKSRFLWFLLRQNYVQSPLQTWKLSLLNYLIAFASLSIGHRDPRVMHEMRSRVVARLRSAIGRF